MGAVPMAEARSSLKDLCDVPPSMLRRALYNELDNDLKRCFRSPDKGRHDPAEAGWSYDVFAGKLVFSGPDADHVRVVVDDIAHAAARFLIARHSFVPRDLNDGSLIGLWRAVTGLMPQKNKANRTLAGGIVVCIDTYDDVKNKSITLIDPTHVRVSMRFSVLQLSEEMARRGLDSSDDLDVLRWKDAAYAVYRALERMDKKECAGYREPGPPTDSPWIIDHIDHVAPPRTTFVNRDTAERVVVPDHILAGKAGYFLNKKPAARVDDPQAVAQEKTEAAAVTGKRPSLFSVPRRLLRHALYQSIDDGLKACFVDPRPEWEGITYDGWSLCNPTDSGVSFVRLMDGEKVSISHEKVPHVAVQYLNAHNRFFIKELYSSELLDIWTVIASLAAAKNKPHVNVVGGYRIFIDSYDNVKDNSVTLVDASGRVSMRFSVLQLSMAMAARNIESSSDFGQVDWGDAAYAVYFALERTDAALFAEYQEPEIQATISWLVDHHELTGVKFTSFVHSETAMRITVSDAALAAKRDDYLKKKPTEVAVVRLHTLTTSVLLAAESVARTQTSTRVVIDRVAAFDLTAALPDYVEIAAVHIREAPSVLFSLEDVSEELAKRGVTSDKPCFTLDDVDDALEWAIEYDWSAGGPIDYTAPGKFSAYINDAAGLITFVRRPDCRRLTVTTGDLNAYTAQKKIASAQAKQPPLKEDWSRIDGWDTDILLFAEKVCRQKLESLPVPSTSYLLVSTGDDSVAIAPSYKERTLSQSLTLHEISRELALRAEPSTDETFHLIDVDIVSRAAACYRALYRDQIPAYLPVDESAAEWEIFAAEADETEYISLVRRSDARRVVIQRDVLSAMARDYLQLNTSAGPCPQKDSNTMNDDEPTTRMKTLTHILKSDATDAAWRTAGSQLTKLARDPLVAALSRRLSPNDDGLRAKIAAFLSTEAGTALVSGLLSIALLLPVPGFSGDVTDRLADELRIKTLAEGSDLLIEVVMGPLRQIMASGIIGEAMVAVRPALAAVEAPRSVPLQDAIGVSTERSRAGGAG